MAIKNFTIRMDEQLIDRLHIVAQYQDRSANSQINFLIRQAVEEFEAKHGKIELKS